MTAQEFDINLVDCDELNLFENTPNIGTVMWLNTKKINDEKYRFRGTGLDVPGYIIDRIQSEESVYEKHGFGIPFRYDNPDATVACAELVVNNVCNCGLSEDSVVRFKCVDNCRRSEKKSGELEGDDMNLNIK